MMMRTSVFVVVWALLTPLLAPATGLAAEAKLGANKDESLLLHLRLNIPGLDFWDGQRKEWRTAPDGGKPAPSSRVRIVHLWSTTCKPCEAEFPILRQMDTQLRSDYQGAVQFIYIADAISSGNLMREFMERNHPTMPLGLLFRDREDRVSAELLRALPAAVVEDSAAPASERQLSLPMTLLIDEDNVVRQAFIGSLTNRRGEFVNSLAQLYDALPPPRSTPAKAKLMVKRSQGSL